MFFSFSFIEITKLWLRINSPFSECVNINEKRGRFKFAPPSLWL